MVKDMKMNLLKKIFTVALVTTTMSTMVGCASNQSSTSASAIETEKAKGDITKPEINFVADSVTIETGAKYSATDNIKSVTDDTDGTLTQVKQASKGAAYYLVDDSKVDTSKAGEYSVTVTAVDKAGNTATKSFKVIVKDDEKKETAKTENKAETKSDSKKDTASKTEKSNSNSKSTASNNSSNGTNPSKKSTNSSKTTSSSSQQSCSQVKTKDAYDEQVLVTGAYDETIVDQQAYDEWKETSPSYTVTVCNGCGAEFTSLEEYQSHAGEYARNNDWSHACYHSTTHQATGYFEHHDAEYKTVHHDAVYNTVHHDAEYTEVCN